MAAEGGLVVERRGRLEESTTVLDDKRIDWQYNCELAVGASKVFYGEGKAVEIMQVLRHSPTKSV